MSLILWYTRTFKIISQRQAEILGLTHARNIYGDEINYLNCRSIWKDSKGKEWRVKELSNN